MKTFATIFALVLWAALGVAEAQTSDEPQLDDVVTSGQAVSVDEGVQDRDIDGPSAEFWSRPAGTTA